MTEPTPDATPEPTPSGQPSTGSGGGLEPNIAAMLSYLLLGWIGGLIMFFTQKHPEVRFHAAQSIIVFGALTVIQTVLSMGSFLLGSLVSLISLVAWILLSIKGYQLEHFKVPVAGDLAERWAAQPA